MSGIAFLFVLDDILMDSVHHHVLAWQETLHRARSVMVMSAYFKSPSESFQTAPPELTHPGLIEIADQHMPTGEETSSRSLGQNSLSFPSRKRTSATTYSFPVAQPTTSLHRVIHLSPALHFRQVWSQSAHRIAWVTPISPWR
jgi:hypothetical protein